MSALSYRICDDGHIIALYGIICSTSCYPFESNFSVFEERMVAREGGGSLPYYIGVSMTLRIHDLAILTECFGVVDGQCETTL